MCTARGATTGRVEPHGEIADPTRSEALQKLKHELVADPQFQRWLTELQDKRLALVFSGGGGKGAYEAGAMLAFFDCGIVNFCSLAGTSVGGLNAALFHQLCRQGDRSLVLRLWGQISPGQVLRVSRGLPLKLLLYFPLALLTFTDLNFMRSGAIRFDIELDSGWEIARRTFFWTLGTVAAVLVAAFLAWYGYHGSLAVLQSLFEVSNPRTLELAAYVGLFLMLPRASDWLGRKLSLASNVPLRKTIESIDIEAIHEHLPLVTCTITIPVSFVSGAGATLNSFDAPLPPPQYVALQQMTPQQAVDLLVQTAALPEVFRPRPILGRNCIDGGLADNTPILGVADDKPDTVFVVYLNHRYGKLDNVKRKELSRIRKIIQTLGANWDGPVVDWLFRTKIVPIIPSEDLGGLFLGTLNFTATKANKLIALGYGDALKQFRQLATVAPR
jgi:predicted acylesterase/phospholipase RssA